MMIIILILVLVLFIIAMPIFIEIWRLITKKPDFPFEVNSSANELIQKVIDEINTALSLEQNELIHKFNPNEPPIDGDVAANITFRVAQVIPCMIIFTYEANGDVKITLERITRGN